MYQDINCWWYIFFEESKVTIIPLQENSELGNMRFFNVSNTPCHLHYIQCVIALNHPPTSTFEWLRSVDPALVNVVRVINMPVLAYIVRGGFISPTRKLRTSNVPLSWQLILKVINSRRNGALKILKRYSNPKRWFTTYIACNLQINEFHNLV